MISQECFKEMYSRFYGSPSFYKEAIFRVRNGCYYYNFSNYKYIKHYLDEIYLGGLIKW